MQHIAQEQSCKKQQSKPMSEPFTGSFGCYTTSDEALSILSTPMSIAETHKVCVCTCEGVAVRMTKVPSQNQQADENYKQTVHHEHVPQQLPALIELACATA